MLGLIRALRRTRVLTAAGLFHLVKSMWATGVNLMTLLRLAAALHPDRIAVVDERDRLSYVELWRQAEALAHGLREQHQIGSGDKVAIVCRNHVAAITAIFSASRLVLLRKIEIA